MQLRGAAQPAGEERPFIEEDATSDTFSVHREVMVRPEMLALERATVFTSSWFYVGHDSEIPEPGDFRRTTVAGRPVMFVRGNDGQVRVLYNSCTHRGAMICRTDSGNAERFQCFYHGWTFDNLGQLATVPGREGFGPRFDADRHRLPSPAQVQGYRGFWFMSPDPSTPPLAEYLEGVRDYIDLTVDSAEPLGGWEVMPGAARFTVKANWKLMIENSVDKYHFPTVHLTYSQYQSQRRKELGTAAAESDRRAAGDETLGFGTPNGHGGFIQYMAGRPIATESSLWSAEANREVRRLHDLLLERFGAERGTEMTEHARHLLIYPNTVFQDSATGFRIRVIDPVDATSMQVTQWELRPRNELAELTASRMENARAFLGPGGLGTPDDVEALESCQIGFSATADLCSDVSRGMYRGPGARMAGDDEEQQRSFWRRWNEQVTGVPRNGRSPAMALSARPAPTSPARP